jgi:hypothetical protein
MVSDSTDIVPEPDEQAEQYRDAMFQDGNTDV